MAGLQRGVQGVSDEVYKFIYDNVPFFAGSDVGAGSRGLFGFTTRGNFQIIDLARGTLQNVVRFTMGGQNVRGLRRSPDGVAAGVLLMRRCLPTLQGSIEVNGSLEPVNERVVRATFRQFKVTVAGLTVLDLPLPFQPVGLVETTFLDEEMRIGRGDKGSVFVTRRVASLLVSDTV